MAASSGPGFFYRGTSHEQTPFFTNKETKLMESREWPDYFNERVDFTKTSLDVMKAWISKRVTELLGTEDDIVIEFILQQLLQEADGSTLADLNEQEQLTASAVDPRKVTVSLTGFIGDAAYPFVEDLWRLLLSAQQSPDGVPEEFAQAQQKEREQKLAEAQRIKQELERLQQHQASRNDRHTHTGTHM